MSWDIKNLLQQGHPTPGPGTDAGPQVIWYRAAQDTVKMTDFFIQR